MKSWIAICLLLLAVVQVRSQVVINELVSSNENGIVDGFGKTRDWLELYNAGEDDVNLQSYHLSDHPGYLTKWTFPDVVIPAKGYLLIFCSGEISNNPNELHANFKLSQSGESVFLSNPNGNVISFVTFGYIPTDQSYAGYNGQSSDFLICSQPTPGFNNELSNGLFYSHVSGFYDEAFQLELYSPLDGGKIYYSQNGHDLSVNKQLYSGDLEVNDISENPYNISGIPTTILEGSPYFEEWIWSEPQSVYMANVFRVGVFLSDTLKSDLISLTYFVDPGMKARYKYPVVSIITDSLNLFDDEIGIYVPGAIYGTDTLSYWPVGNFTQRGSEWEREMYISYFEPTGEQVFETAAGMRIRGFGSSGHSQKSLNIYFRKEYGQNKIEAPLFSESPVSDYKRLVFRNGGNDFPDAHLKDSYLSGVISSLNVEIQEYEPIVLFINGEYWGMHNMREKMDKHHFRYKYDLSKDEINILGVCGMVKDGGIADYFDLIDYIETHDLADDDVYGYVSEKIDIESAIDYNIAEIYFANYDWPCNNYKMWKTNTPGDKWKYIIYDLDFSTGYSHLASYSTNSLEHAVTAGTDWPTCGCANVILRNLLKNETFVNQFLDRFKYCLENVFDRDIMHNALDTFVEEYSHGISEHIERFNFPNSVAAWHENIGVLREFIDHRPCYMREHIMEFFEDHSFDYDCGEEFEVPEDEPGIEEPEEEPVVVEVFDEQWAIYPNPSNGVFNIHNNSGENFEIEAIEIFDAIGKRVFSVKNLGIEIANHSNYELKLDNLASGVYIMKVGNASDLMSFKVVIR